MVFTRLSDTELRRVVQEDEELAPGAREELEQRHYQAVRAFAGVVSPQQADALAGQAWRQALRPLDEDTTGAVRPRALADVLRTAAEWLRTDRRGALAPELAAWFEPDGAGAAADRAGTGRADTGRGPASAADIPGGPAVNIVAARDVVAAAEAAAAAAAAEAGPAGGGGAGDAGAARLAYCRSSSVTARAFERIPDRSQTVLWHVEVEHDDEAVIQRLLGAEAEDVSLLNRRARRELYNAYVSLHQNETRDDACRRLHRMVLAYAEQTSMNTPGDLVSHLDGCERCSRTVDDLERMRFEFGVVLAEELLPWGGSEYALAAHTVSSTTLGVPDPYGPYGHHDADGYGEDPRGAAAGATPWAASPFASASGAAGPGGPGRGVLGGLRSRVLALPGVARLTGGESASRTRRVVLSAALVGLCSLVVAVAYTGGLRQGAENSGAAGPGATGAPGKPGASEPTATATSTVTATRPPGGGKGYEPSSPVRGAELEWLFNAVDDGVTVDTSGNGTEGALDGDPLPELGKGDVLEFDGQQSVVADGPVVDTSKSFSVSARAKMNDTEDFQTVVSQDAGAISGFSVQYDPDSDRWEMIMPEEDDADSDLVQAGSGPGPAADTWTYLTGVYDAGEGEIRLYVDGELEDTAHFDDGSADGGGAASGGSASGGAATGGGSVSGSSSTTTTTTTSGGGDGSDGSGGFGGGGRPGGGGGDGGFGGGGRPGGGGGGGFFGGQRGAQNIAAHQAAGRGTFQSVDAEGDFVAGRGLAGDEFVRGFDGAIDDVRAFKRALTAKEAAALAGR